MPGPDHRAGLLQDTQETTEPSHTATATLVLEVQPVDLRPPWFLPCSYSDAFVCIHAQYRGAVPTGHRLVPGDPKEQGGRGAGPGCWGP